MEQQRISSLLERGSQQSLSPASIYALNVEEHLYGVTLTNVIKSTHGSTESKISSVENSKQSQISREENQSWLHWRTPDFPRVVLVASYSSTSSDWCVTFDLIGRCNGSVGFGLMTEIRLTANVFWGYDWTKFHFISLKKLHNLD